MDLEELANQNYEFFKKKDNGSADNKSSIIRFLYNIINDFEYPDFNDEEDFQFYYKISKEDINLITSIKKSNIVSARLYDYLISFKGGNSFSYAKLAVKSYEKAFFDNENFEYKCSCINKIVFISRRYNLDCANFIRSNVIFLLDISSKQGLFYYHILELSLMYSAVDSSKLLTSCIKQLFSSKNNFGFLFDEYFGLSLKIIDFQHRKALINENKFNKTKEKLYVLKARIFERIGDMVLEPNRKCHNYQIAINTYKSINYNMLSPNVKKLRDKMDESQKEALNNMTLFTESIDFSYLIKKIKGQLELLPKEKVITQLINCGGIQSKEKQIEAVKKNSKKYPLYGMSQTSIVNSDGKQISILRSLHSGKNNEENYEIILEYAYDNIRINSQILGQVISIIINAINEKGINIEESIKTIVNNSYVITGTRKKIVIKGLIYGLKYDLESSLSILVPQFENAIRELAYICGDSKYKINPELIESVNGLEYYFKKDSVLENTIDEDLFFTLNSVFVNEHGLNYRNNYAHGCIENFNDYTSLYVWWLILYFVTTYS